MKSISKPWDMSAHIKTPEEEAAYLEAALEDGDTEVFLEVLGAIIKARGAARVASRSGVHRRTAYSFRKGANPTLSTLQRVLEEVGMKLTVCPLHRETTKSDASSVAKAATKTARKAAPRSAAKATQAAR